MKKILEVLQCENGEIRFNTDINVDKNPEEIMNIAPMAAISMATKLWGGNESAVLAVIRALMIADLSLSVNRKEMVRGMTQSAETLERCILEAKKEFEKSGGKITIMSPGIKSPKTCS